MYPWGYTCRNDLPDASSIAEGAKRAVNALKATHGISFQNGPICNVIYQASGSSVDDTYSLGVHYSYAVELRDQGQHGFILPAAQIVPSGEETLNALIALWQYVATQV